MSFHIDAVSLLRWLHFVALAVGGGSAVVALLLSGFEEGREDLRGLAATVWSRYVAWAFRIAVLAGAALLVSLMRQGMAFADFGLGFHLKLLFAIVLLGLSEMSKRPLSQGKRGSALLVLVLFLAASFFAYNRDFIAKRALPAAEPPVASSAAH